MKIWLIGAGYMATEYSKVLDALNSEYLVIGRGQNSAKSFENKTDKNVFIGGVSLALEKLDVPQFAIVATGVDSLASTAKSLIEAGVESILIEKPGGVNLREIESIANLSNKMSCKVLLGYNRRFYSSTISAIDLIEKDGGARSFTFDFTEWSHVIRPLEKNKVIKESWFISNSSHVADLAFFLGGFPIEINSLNRGSLDWHSSSSIFCGSGITEKNALFSYVANWSSPGRWSLELMTDKRRLIFRPLEELREIKHGSLEEYKISPKDDLDITFKPGVYRMVDSFLQKDESLFCSIEDQLEHFALYCAIAGYD